MFLTRKIRIWPSRQQMKVLWDLSEKCRLLYNFSLHERKENWKLQQEKLKKERRYITYRQQSKNLPILKQLYPEYSWVYSKVLQQVLKKLEENFRSFFSLYKRGDPAVRPPRFRGKNHFFTLCYNQSGFKIADDRLILSHKHPSKAKLTFSLPIPINGSDPIKQVEIKYDYPREMWFACIVFEINTPPYKDNGLYQAIDLGVSNIVSAVMNTRANTIIIGDLRVKQLAKKQKCSGNGRITKARKTLNHSMQNTGSLGRFARFLTYKAELVGKRIIRIDESYTTQLCCGCKKYVKRALSERIIQCDCGLRMERDLNSAVNIMERFLEQKSQFDFLSQQPSVTEESFRKRLDLLRYTAPSSSNAGDGGLVENGS